MSSLVLKLKQTQQLNQRLQQSLRILQMSGLELEREVEDWLLDNPLLERPETDEFADSGLNRAVTMPRAGQQLSGDDAEDIWSNIAEEEDFKHYLHAQVCEHPLSQVEAAYVHVLIDFFGRTRLSHRQPRRNHRPHAVRMDVGRRRPAKCAGCIANL